MVAARPTIRCVPPISTTTIPRKANAPITENQRMKTLMAKISHAGRRTICPRPARRDGPRTTGRFGRRSANSQKASTPAA